MKKKLLIVTAVAAFGNAHLLCMDNQGQASAPALLYTFVDKASDGLASTMTKRVLADGRRLTKDHIEALYKKIADTPCGPIFQRDLNTLLASHVMCRQDWDLLQDLAIPEQRGAPDGEENKSILASGSPQEVANLLVRGMRRIEALAQARGTDSLAPAVLAGTWKNAHASLTGVAVTARAELADVARNPAVVAAKKRFDATFDEHLNVRQRWGWFKKTCVVAIPLLAIIITLMYKSHGKKTAKPQAHTA